MILMLMLLPFQVTLAPSVLTMRAGADEHAPGCDPAHDVSPFYIFLCVSL